MPSSLSRHITDFLEYLEIERGRSPRTLQNYDFYLRRFATWSKNLRPEALTAEHIRQYRLWLNRALPGREAETIKKNTQNYHLIALRSFLKYLAKRDVKTLAPEKIELAKQTIREVAFLEPDELARMLTLAHRDIGAPDADSRICLRDVALLETLFSTGLRVSELSSLKIEGVNISRGEFSVRGKGGKVRVVFLSDAAKEALKAYLASRRDPSPFVFVSHDRAKKGREDSGPLTPRSIERIVQAYARRAGVVKRITPHTLRHTFATDLLRSGADIRAVQSLLGHASITTTQVYTHVTNAHLRDVHKKFHGKSGR